jgi:hypothetical protein
VVSDREEQLASHLGTPLGSERAAADRNWRALSAAISAPPPRRSGALRAIATTAALAAVVLLALSWWQGARVDVAGDRLPVLYRQEVARTAITAPGIDATLAIEQKHIESDARLRAVGVTDVRLGADRLPATIELRFQPFSGADTYGVLAHSEVSDPRRATGTTRTLYEAPFPPLAPRERATYRVWLHIETATGAIDSSVLVIQVTDQPEGQRASDRIPSAP